MITINIWNLLNQKWVNGGIGSLDSTVSEFGIKLNGKESEDFFAEIIASDSYQSIKIIRKKDKKEFFPPHFLIHDGYQAFTHIEYGAPINLSLDIDIALNKAAGDLTN